MFTGEYNHSIDAKGRIVLPAKFREELGERFYITKGNITSKDNRNVCVYTEEAWHDYVEKLNSIPASDKLAIKFVRSITSGASICEPDKNGRVPIPQTLRDFACLDKDVVSIGLINRIEIWDKSKWDAYNDDNFDEAELDEALSKYGI
jgi:MraZ protein